MESIESRTPPRPSISFPESLTCADRFRTDSIRSPMSAVKESRNENIPVAQRGIEITSGKKYPKMIPAQTADTEPEIYPTILFFGLDLKGFHDLRPKRSPKIYAAVSFVKTTRRKNMISPDV